MIDASPNVIAAKTWEQTVASTDGSSKIGIGQAEVARATQSPNFIDGKSGWRLNPNGIVDIAELNIGNLYPYKQTFASYFESIDGWQKTGGINYSASSCMLYTTGTIDTERYMYAESYSSALEVNFQTKNPTLTTGMVFEDNTDQQIFFGLGVYPVDSYAAGFIVTDNSMDAITVDNGSYTTTNVGTIDLNQLNIYKIVTDSPAQKIAFYINNRLVAVHTTNIPSIPNPISVGYRIKNTASVNKQMYISFCHFQQDR